MEFSTVANIIISQSIFSFTPNLEGASIVSPSVDVPSELNSMLIGQHGPPSRRARLVVDLASTAGASEFVRVSNAHVSGVSVITPGHGLRRFFRFIW